MKPTNMLERIGKVKKEEVACLKNTMPLEELREKVKNLPPGVDFRRALESVDCAVIAEVKKHSPSSGSLREDADHRRMASLYEGHGAAAVSVLTDRVFFHGAPEYLTEIKKEIRIPVLRKDFVIDSYQVYEAKSMGADALLLISALLPAERLREYILIALSLGMWPLVEVHSRMELEAAVDAGAEIIGINNRDLKTFTTDINTTVELAPFVPAGKTVISESGIRTREDVERLMKVGVHIFLIGEALMRAPDPGRKLEELTGGRAGS